MQHFHLIAALLVSCAVRTISQLENTEFGSCRLNCGDRSQDLPIQKGVIGDPGQVGEVGERGDYGPTGEPGEEGNAASSCQCLLQTSKEIDEINSMLDARKTEECPQSRFRFLYTTSDAVNYVRIKSSLPPLSNATICAFVTSKHYSGSVVGTIFSYATPGLKALALYLYRGIEVSLYGETKVISKNDLNFRKEWHICLAFSRPAGFAEFYVNGKLYGKLDYERREPIPTGGNFVLGQVQDSVYNFDGDKFFFGEIRNFMVWDRLLTEEEMSPSRSSSCACVKDYILAPTHDTFQLIKKAKAMVVNKCT